MRYALNAMSKFIPVMKNAKLNLWRAVYIERCTYGSGASAWKPTVERRQGAGHLAYIASLAGLNLVRLALFSAV